MAHSSATINPEFVIAGRRPADAPGSLSSPVGARAGEVPYGTNDVTGARWGDYFAVAIDPRNSDCAWLVGEYARVGPGFDSWGTFITAASYGDRCDPDLDGWSDGAEARIGTNSLLACGTNGHPADFNSDLFFTGFDLDAVAGDIGRTVPPAPARKDIAPDPPDGAVTGIDLDQVAGRIGTACTT